MKKSIFLIPFCLILAGSCKFKKSETDEGNVSVMLPDRISQVKAFRLEYSDFSHELISNGTITAKHKVDLQFPSPDVVAAIYVKNGDRVAKDSFVRQV